MTKQEFEQKCSIMASTPQPRWFDLRLRALETMLNNALVPRLDITHLFPSAQYNGFFGYVFKLDGQYYFWLYYKQGNVIECFNIEVISFSMTDNILSSGIILSSDDDSDRRTFLPLLMSHSGFSTRSSLKMKLDLFFGV